VTELPAVVVQAATALGLDPAGLRGLRGASGSSWDAGPAVLRVGPRVAVDRELAAAGAAAAVLPVPGVLDRADFADHSALLLERLPGRPAGELAMGGPGPARAAGLACGRVYEVLAGVAAPAGLRAAPGVHGPASAGPARLLHLPQASTSRPRFLRPWNPAASRSPASPSTSASAPSSLCVCRS